MHARLLLVALIVTLAGTGIALYTLWGASQSAQLPPEEPAALHRIPLAVLGDSDSHAYHDTVSFPEGSPDRGGRYRSQTWQWVEVLAQLRGQELDLGPWGTWGTRGSVARLHDLLGWGGRSPRKMDYRHNFAISGAVCQDLGPGHMAQRLVTLMSQAPEYWARGVVVIRIGVNDVGTRAALNEWAKDGPHPALEARVADCVAQYRETVALIRQTHPGTRIMLVGLFNNSHWAPLIQKWQDPAALARIQAAIDTFNQPLQALAASDPHLSYFDDQAWFASHWGGRGPSGQPAYKVATIDGRWPTSNTQGDAPSHATVDDGHAGTVWNLLWSQALVHQLNQAFALGLTELSDAELAAFLTDHGIVSGLSPLSPASAPSGPAR
ncbi:MAG TPA: SGNH/GDSL hydrolase family protein [Aquabacterium sp.]|nr:SGNH/GDSL hydrolase family protein [Aquabacterium sp.]